MVSKCGGSSPRRWLAMNEAFGLQNGHGMQAQICRGFRGGLRTTSRRGLLQLGSLGTLAGALGGIPQGWSAELQGTASSPAGLTQATGFGRAKSCILLFMWGGPSHLDTWDLKPDAPVEVRGEFQSITTAVAGISVSEHFPRLSRHMEQLAVVRSLSHDDPAHLSSVHHLLTGRHAPQVKSDDVPPSRKDSPVIGSAVHRLRPATGLLPGSVMLPWMVNHPSAPGGTAPGQHAGWLGAAHDPFLLTGDPNRPDWRVSGLRAGEGLPAERMQRRSDLLASVNGTDGEGFSGLQERALRMLTDPEVEAAFDLNRESPETRERYGRHIHGQCVLLARRLIESGVRFVCVNWHQDGANFWDTHGNNFGRLKNDLMPPSDRAFAALLTDLAERGMLDETLVVWAGEFGRKPQITPGNAGREHWPWCGSAVLAGGGIQGGQVYGRSDRLGGYPVENPVSPADIAATMYHALGIPADGEIVDRVGRPQRLTEGLPLLALF